MKPGDLVRKKSDVTCKVGTVFNVQNTGFISQALMVEVRWDIKDWRRVHSTFHGPEELEGPGFAGARRKGKR